MWATVQLPAAVTAWVLLAAYAKTAFHWGRASSVVPVSALLVVLGILVGLVFIALDVRAVDVQLDSHVFFLYLLPPIVFEAGYSMPVRPFFGNLGTVCTYAFVGTLWNSGTIGASVWAASQAGLFAGDGFRFLECLLFGAIISAVDPVAVLCVFEEIHVNELLYIAVFGESLLNDAVTVVLYDTFKWLCQLERVRAHHILLGIASLFAKSLGGLALGLCAGALTALTTRFTNHVKILNPLFVCLLAYAAYLTAEAVRVSSILAIVFCGLSMKQYVKVNVSRKSFISLKYLLKMMCETSESLIFLLLGLSTVLILYHSHHTVDWRFVVFVLIACALFRAIGVYMQTRVLNRYRLEKFSFVDQFIMAYGGLRGAIAYGLVVSIPAPQVVSTATKERFESACIGVILFTVMLQGTTIKPLVNLLQVKRAHSEKETLNELLFSRINEHTLAGVESVAGSRGTASWLKSFDYLNTLYLKRWLLREGAVSGDMAIVHSFVRHEIDEAVGMCKTDPTWLQSYKRHTSQLNLELEGSKVATQLEAGGLNGNTDCPNLRQAFSEAISDARRPGDW